VAHTSRHPALGEGSFRSRSSSGGVACVDGNFGGSPGPQAASNRRRRRGQVRGLIYPPVPTPVYGPPRRSGPLVDWQRHQDPSTLPKYSRSRLARAGRGFSKTIRERAAAPFDRLPHIAPGRP
jgi:hypothetical protein